MSKSKGSKKSFGQAVIDSFQDFFDSVDRGEPITARTVKLNLEPRRFTKVEVERLRNQLGVSQAVFAQLLAVSPKLVQAWEQGKREPSPMAGVLLAESERNPREWLKRRLDEAAPAQPAVPARAVKRPMQHA